MVKKNRNVAIVGVGQTYHKRRRPDVTQVELVNEAVRAALKDAQLDIADIDVIVHGNMELFEGNYQGDMWHVDGDGAYMKSGIRITTGGTTGGTLVCATDNIVASGLYDVALCVGFEKMEEGEATGGITGMADPLWFRWMMSGALTGATFAERLEALTMEQLERLELVAAKLRVQLADNAVRNPYAHLRMKLTVDDVMNSRLLVYPLRLLHMCPESSGACALILASEEKAERITGKPVWIKDHVTTHLEDFVVGVITEAESTMRRCARKLYERNKITNPLKQIDTFELYDPNVWWHMDWMTEFLFLKPGENIEMVEKGVTALEGDFPINASGGVVSTNPIGATAMLRVAEAALQIRGDAGEHQIPKEVNTAMSSSFGGSTWSILHLLAKEKPK
ncbi:thiolase family protein [Candidatus Bathyarchaeota archaeon]|nr:thiolase family protein [Candidatus Bathyarchaeota archaeon]